VESGEAGEVAGVEEECGGSFCGFEQYLGVADRSAWPVESFARGRHAIVSIMITIFALLIGLLTPNDSPTIEVSPVRPMQGSLLTITIRNAETWPGVSGRFAGESLHFERHPAGFCALAAVPVDAPASLTLEVTPEGRSAEAQRRTVPIAKERYRTQRLRVASQYGRAPNAATKARIAREIEKAKQVSLQSHQTPRMWRLPFIKPTGGQMTSPFGTARVFNGSSTGR
jgi:hypothetical protein